MTLEWSVSSHSENASRHVSIKSSDTHQAQDLGPETSMWILWVWVGQAVRMSFGCWVQSLLFPLMARTEQCRRDNKAPNR